MNCKKTLRKGKEGKTTSEALTTNTRSKDNCTGHLLTGMLEIPYWTDRPDPALFPIGICVKAGRVPKGLVTGTGVSDIRFWVFLHNISSHQNYHVCHQYNKLRFLMVCHLSCF
jgi:hypothetical protein